MRKKNWLVFGLLFLILTATLLVTRSSASDKNVPVSSPTCCKKSAGKCQESEKKTGNDGMIIENLSRQFIQIPLITH